MRFFLLLIICMQFFFTQSKPFYSFERISTENGLSNNAVTAIQKDKNGFMWFSTENGLNRFDGNHFRVFLHNPEDKSSICSNLIWNMIYTSKGKIILATQNGLSVFDPVTEKAFNYFHVENDSTSLPHNAILSLLEDRSGIIWIGSADGHLSAFTPLTGKFKTYLTPKYNLLPERPGYIVRLLEDEGKLWVGKYDGLSIFDPSKEKFEILEINKNKSDAFHSVVVRSLFKDNENIYIGSRDAGIDIYNRKSKKVTHIKPLNQTDQMVYQLIGDDTGNLWVGFYGGGIQILDSRHKLISGLQFDVNNYSSLSDNYINSSFKDEFGNIWLGTYYNGISIYKPKSMTYKFCLLSQAGNSDENLVLSSLIDENKVLAVSETNVYEFFTKEMVYRKLFRFDESVKVGNMLSDNNKNYWLATDKGLYHYNTQSKEVKKFFTKKKIFSLFVYLNEVYFNSDKTIYKINNQSGDITSFQINNSKSKTLIQITHNPFNKNQIYCSFEDGFYVFDLESTSLKKVKNSPDLRLLVKYIDQKGKLYFSSPKGLINYSIREEKFNFQFMNSINLSSYVNYFINKKGDLFCCNSDALYVFDRRSNLFRLVFDQEQLNTIGAMNIVEDKNGLLWLIGDDIYIYNSESGNLNKNLSINSYNLFINPVGHSALDDGNILLSTAKGFIIINNNQFINKEKKNIILSDLFINGKPAISMKSTKNEYNNLFYLELPHTTQSIDFYFSVLDYKEPYSYNYYFKIDDLDTDWKQLNPQDKLALRYLQPGDYKLKIKAFNIKTNEFSDEKEILVSISPPFYATIYFRGLIILVIIFTIIILHKFRTRSIKKRNSELQKFNEELTREINYRTAAEQKTEKLAKMLIDVNHELEELLYISTHDLRAPLVNIHGFSKELDVLVKKVLNEIKHILEEENDSELTDILKTEIPNYLSFITSNTEKMDQLLKALLSYSRIRRQEFNPVLINTNELFDKIIENYKHFIEIKSMKIEKDRIPDVYGDLRYIQIVFENLLNNAIKYMPINKNGYIRISGYVEENNIIIIIEDNGDGIPKNYTEKIFNIFYRIDPSRSGEVGIGLPIVAKIIKMHNGNIVMLSDKGQGVKIEIRLPVKSFN